jgi:hypothetical protein
MVLLDMSEDAKISTSPGHPEGEPPAAVALESNHSDLVVVFGALSLFLCGPLGILAWIIAESDLRKIRKGRMSSEKIRWLKVGRVLAVIGTLIFGVAVVLGILAINKGVWFFGRGMADLAGPYPLPPSKIAFVGDWYGNQGTLIQIREDGRGGFRTRHTSMTGGRVTIGDDHITIGFLGFSKTWKITKGPALAGSYWTMELDGEVFIKKSRGLYVRASREWGVMHRQGASRTRAASFCTHLL